MQEQSLAQKSVIETGLIQEDQFVITLKKFKFLVELNSKETHLKDIFPAYTDTFLLVLQKIIPEKEDEKNQGRRRGRIARREQQARKKDQNIQYIFRHVDSSGRTLKQHSLCCKIYKMMSNELLIVAKPIVSQDKKEQKQEQLKEQQNDRRPNYKLKNQNKVQIISWSLKEKQFKIQGIVQLESNLQKVQKNEGTQQTSRASTFQNIILFHQSKLLCIVWFTRTRSSKDKIFAYYKLSSEGLAPVYYFKCEQMSPISSRNLRIIPRKQTTHYGKIDNQSCILYANHPHFDSVINQGLLQIQDKIDADQVQKRVKFVFQKYNQTKTLTCDCFSLQNQLYAYLVPKNVALVKKDCLLLEYSANTIPMRKHYSKNGIVKKIVFDHYLPNRMFLWDITKNVCKVINQFSKKEQNIQFSSVVRKYMPYQYKGFKFNFYPIIFVNSQTLKTQKVVAQEGEPCDNVDYCDYDNKIFIEKNQKEVEKGIQVYLKINKIGQN